jgi:CO/xanthine dehydrogenase FAD-binding subunit
MLSAVELPASAPAAVALLASAGDGAALMAGGTLVMPALLHGDQATRRLIVLAKAGLGGIELRAGSATIGAGVTFARLAAQPGLAVLRPALASIGSPTLRNMATVGGNLFAPQPYGDFAACLVALDATAAVLSPAGERSLALERLLQEGIGRQEIVTAVRFALPDPARWTYLKAMRRQLNSAAIVTVAAHLPLAGGVVQGARIALGGVAPTVVRARAAEAVLEGQALTGAVIARAAEAALHDIDPADDAYASAWYRRRVLPVHLRRALAGLTGDAS